MRKNKATKATIHPWNIDDVYKGWQLSIEELESITGKNRETKDYDLAVLTLRQRLKTELEKDKRVCCVAIVKGALRVLTDSEAVTYTMNESNRGIRKVLRSHRDMMAIDTRNLTAKELETLSRNRIISGKRVAAQRGNRRAPKIRLKAKPTEKLCGIEDRDNCHLGGCRSDLDRQIDTLLTSARCSR